MADKNLKLSFQLDDQSFNRVKSAIQSLTSELQKLNQAGGSALGGGGGLFPGINVGGKTPSRQQTIQKGKEKQGQIGQISFGNVILDQASAFKKFAAEGTAASKVMTDALRRDIVEQERSLDRLKSKLEGLNDEFAEATKKQKEFLASGKTTEASAMNNYIKGVEGRIAETSSQTLGGYKNLTASRDALPGAPTSGGFMRGMGYSGSGFGGGMQGFVAGVSKAVTGALAAANFGMNEYMAGGGGIFSNDVNNAGQGGMDLRAEARRGRMLNQRIRALRGGDTTQLMLYDELNRDPAKSKYLQQQYGALSAIQAYKGGAVRGLANTLGVAGALGMESGDSGVLENLTPTEIQTRLLANIQRTEDLQSNTTDFDRRKYAMESWRGSLGSRANATRIMGTTLEGRVVNGRRVGAFGNINEWAAENLLSPETVVGNYASLRQMGGSRFAGSLAQYETLSQAGGYSGFGNLAAAANRGAKNPQEALMLARAALGGGISAGAGMQLGHLAYGYNPLGTTSGAGLMSAIQSGVNWSGMSEGQQFNKVQSIAGAMQAANSMMSGSLDPATLASSTINAKRILGSDTTNPNRLGTRAIDYLAGGMDLRQAADIGFRGAARTDAMSVYGIGASDVRQMVGLKIASLLRAETTDPATSGAVGKVISMLENGVTPQAAMASLSGMEKKQLRVAAQNRMRVGGEEAGSLIDVLGEFGLRTKDRALRTGDALGGRLTGLEAAEGQRARTEAAQTEDDIRAESRSGAAGRIKATTEAAKTQREFGSNLGASVDLLVSHLDRLSSAIQKVVDRSGNSSGMAPVKVKGADSAPNTGGRR